MVLCAYLPEFQSRRRRAAAGGAHVQTPWDGRMECEGMGLFWGGLCGDVGEVHGICWEVARMEENEDECVCFMRLQDFEGNLDRQFFIGL